MQRIRLVRVQLAAAGRLAHIVQARRPTWASESALIVQPSHVSETMSLASGRGQSGSQSVSQHRTTSYRRACAHIQTKTFKQLLITSILIMPLLICSWITRVPTLYAAITTTATEQTRQRCCFKLKFSELHGTFSHCTVQSRSIPISKFHGGV
jgi:hypothetical protein